ncbi:MAG TPA: undecaprenyl-diphosphate phosphatase [Candidatus Saccharimonadales bacterium]|nr:undecaprenyl-diphosphate phosphatase [Candidatus Saccharimonadales bacterium]
MLTYFQAIILGLLQGVTELFPVSSLGHSVLIANLFGWHNLSDQQQGGSGAFLTMLIMMHVATAIALLIFYRGQWVRIVKGFVRSVRVRKVGTDSDAKLAWLLIAATIPAALFGMVFEHKLRATFASAFFAIIFIILNGIMLIKGDRLVAVAELNRPRRRRGADTDDLAASKTARVVSDHLTIERAVLIGVAQIGALFAGISRSGITMLAALRSGLDHQDAARFSFLLATPIILGAGIYKLPMVLSSANDGIRGQILVGSLLAGVGAYVSVRFLDKYFRTKSLKPFGWYCIGFGLLVLLVSIIRGAS